ncbi:MAG: hypothetical protein A2Z34_04070 [Planctomycetes bacterium RBG_16_59_8]|nr:MAG: hypothetical protein A2Z34_04070 [Planctomycetes bacterium RBG_16_59_8]
MKFSPLGFLKGLLFDNLMTKIMALLLALLLWTYLVYSSMDKDTRDVPFRLELPPDISVRSVALEEGTILTDTIAVELTATKGMFNSINFGGVRCLHKVTTKISGPETINETITRNDFNLPEGVSVKPIRIKINLVPLVEKEVRVVASLADCAGAPAEGYMVRSVRSLREKVKVRAPANVAESVSEVFIEPIPVEGRKEHFVVRTKVHDRGGFGIVALEEVEVDVVILPNPDHREITLPVFFAAPIGFPYGVEVTPREAAVRLEGPKSALDDLLSSSGGVELSFRLPHPANSVAAGQKFNLPLECRFARKGYDAVVTAVIAPSEVQVEIKPAGEGEK